MQNGDCDAKDRWDIKRETVRARSDTPLAFEHFQDLSMT